MHIQVTFYTVELYNFDLFQNNDQLKTKFCMQKPQKKVKFISR